jgi:DNA mismatch endonuclease (patch repair protein)
VNVRPIASLNRRADIVFARQRVAVFVDGCFWHGCPDHGTRRHTVNDWYWPAKIARNVARDHETNRLLCEAGWRVVRVWEHADVRDVAARIEALVRSPDDSELKIS